jgi:hypothetical protein
VPKTWQEARCFLAVALFTKTLSKLTLAHAVVAQDIAVVPEFLNDGVRIHLFFFDQVENVFQGHDKVWNALLENRIESAVVDIAVFMGENVTESDDA